MVNALQLEAVPHRASRAGLFLTKFVQTAISRLSIKLQTSPLDSATPISQKRVIIWRSNDVFVYTSNTGFQQNPPICDSVIDDSTNFLGAFSAGKFVAFIGPQFSKLAGSNYTELFEHIDPTYCRRFPLFLPTYCSLPNDSASMSTV